MGASTIVIHPDRGFPHDSISENRCLGVSLQILDDAIELCRKINLESRLQDSWDGVFYVIGLQLEPLSLMNNERIFKGHGILESTRLASANSLERFT